MCLLGVGSLAGEQLQWIAGMLDTGLLQSVSEMQAVQLYTDMKNMQVSLAEIAIGSVQPLTCCRA